MKPVRYFCPCCQQRKPPRRPLRPALPMSLWNPDGETLSMTPTQARER